LSPQLVFHEEPRYFLIRYLCCLVHYFLILLIYLRLFGPVICIFLNIMLSMTLRKRLTVIIYLTLHLLFLVILGFFLLLLRLGLLIPILIFDALIQQLLIDHNNFLNGLVTVSLLLTCIINDQSLLLCEKAWRMEFPTMVRAFITPIKWRIRATVGLSVSASRCQ
jgi:hypothetical protein